MVFPNLLYQNPPTTAPFDPELFEDLQFTQLMPDCDFSPVLFPLDRASLPARQQFFASLEDRLFTEHLSELHRSVAKMRVLYEALQEASCPPETHVIFASLMAEMITFAATAAADDGDGALRCRFHVFFKDLIQSEAFRTLRTDTDAVLAHVSEINTYVIRLHGKDIHVEKRSGESFLSRIRRCNENLELAPIELRPTKPRSLSVQIIDAFRQLHPEIFSQFAAYHEKHKADFHKEILEYEAPLSFYLSMGKMLDRVRASGIPLIYPICTDEPGIHIIEAYDISLLAKNETNIVPNDIDFDPSAPFFYLTGANGGGKTTYLRTVGIACVLLLLGAPIPARSAKVSIPSGVFTHFPRDERFDGSGRFVEEHRRVEAILARADQNALILLNETYSTTNEENAVRMTAQLADQVFKRGNFGLYITHQHALGQTEIPYLNVLVDKDDNNRRTFKIVRQKNTGGSYAEDILIKYRLTVKDLHERFGGDAL